MNLKITKCIDPKCPFIDICERNVLKSPLENDDELFFDSPREENAKYCVMLWSDQSTGIIENLEEIMK